MATLRNGPNTKARPLARAHHMRRRSCMPIGSRLITGRPTAFMLQTGFCSTTRALSVARLSLPGKSLERSQQLNSGFNRGSFSAISMPSGDWGHARDYVEGMWRIVRHPKPDRLWCSRPGETHSVREFVEKAFAQNRNTHYLERAGA